MKKERLKKSLLYFNAALFSNTNHDLIPEKTIVCNHDQVVFYASTPNTIIYYKTKDETGFFRECKKHTDPHDFVWQLIEEYCKYVFKNENSRECEKILKDNLSNKKMLYRFFHMGAGTSSYTPITKFRHSLDSSLIGIDKPYPRWFKDQLLDLVQFAWGALDEYHYCIRSPKDSYHVYNFNRTITTKRVFNMLGEPDLVPECSVVKLILDNEERMGVSVDVAPGGPPEKYNIHGISPSFQCQSLILNIADVICYQKDHRPGNYFIQEKKGVVTGLCAFDNDCPTTLLNIPSISFPTYIGCSSIVDQKGYLNRPFLDKRSTERLLSIQKKDIYDLISDSCSRAERLMLWIRINKLQKAIRKSISSGCLKLLENEEWGNDTIKEEISGKYGTTYLKALYNLITK